MASDEIERFRREMIERGGLRLTPNLVGPSSVLVEGIVGKGHTLTLEHLKDMRPATIAFHLTRHLLFTKYRDPARNPSFTPSAVSPCRWIWLASSPSFR